MNILHINSYLVDRFFYNGLYKEQLNSNYKIKVYVSIPNGGSYKAEELGKHVIVKEDHKDWEKYLFFLKQNRIVSSVKKNIDVQKYQIIHAHSWYTNGYVAMKLGKEYNLPYIVAVRNGDVNNFYKKIFFLRSVGHRIFLNASKIVFLSETYKQKVLGELLPTHMRNQMKEKSIVIPNGIDDYWFSNIFDKKVDALRKSIRVLYVGEITRNKNIMSTIEALYIIKNMGYKVSLTVIGTVKDTSEFKKILNHDFVYYKEKENKENLLLEYRNHDVFVMPSITEAFGLVYAEAMSQGLPVIYTKEQGFDRQFEEGYIGYSVNCYDPADIAEKILKVAENNEELSRNCVNAVIKFKWSNLSRYYHEVYKDAIKLKV